MTPTSLWRQLSRGLRALIAPARTDTDIAAEVNDYLERATAAHVKRGLSQDAAHRAARLELGGATQVGEQVRVSGWEHVISTLLSDLRLAARGLRNRPAFAIVATLTLALGIGASTAIFSAVYPILFEPLPYPHAERIATLWYRGQGDISAMQSFGNYVEVAERSRAFDAIAAWKDWQPTLVGAAEPERLDGQRVSASYFRALGVAPALGRDFDSADDRLRGPDVAIISDALWRRRFASDSAIIGRQVTLNETEFTVLGVMPAGFENVLSPSASIWALLQYDRALPADGREWGHHLKVVGRLHAGTNMAAARTELEQIARTPVPDFTRQRSSLMPVGMIVNPLRDDVTRAVRPALLAVLGAVSLLLLIASVNVANLLLARAAQRRAEFAMRAALGASRARVVQQLLTESLLLAFLGGALGLAIANAGVRALVALSPERMPRMHAIGVNAPAFVFTLLISALVGVVVGLIPVRHASRSALAIGVSEGSRRTAGGHSFMRGMLVAAEVALALVLLVNAGLLVRSLDRVLSVSPGFDPSHLVTMQVQIASPHRYPRDSDFNRFYDEALAAVRALPGVTHAAFTSELPLDGADVANDEYSAQIDTASRGGPGQAAALRYAVTPGYFEAMRIPLRKGRLFDSHDVAGATVRPLIISESFAKRVFGADDPIGRRMRLGGPPNRPWDEVVGVVGDVRQASLATSPNDAIYATTAQWLWAETPLWLVVRAQQDAASLTPAIRRAVWSVDKDQPIIRVSTVDAMVATSESQRHFVLIVFEAFGLAALGLAAIGIYGVLAGSVTERFREIGVRTALGASASSILGLVLREGMVFTAAGAAVGLIAAAATSRVAAAFLFGISPLDPTTYVGVVVVMALVAAIACLIPARRAAGVDPTISLRAE